MIGEQSTYRPLRSPFAFVGGKHSIAPLLRQFFPKQYCTYIEVFGGSGALLLTLPPSHTDCEVFNDYDEHLVNFWLVVKNRPQELIQTLEAMPYARAFRARLVAEWKRGNYGATDVERAARWFFLIRSTVVPSLQKLTSVTFRGPSWRGDKESMRDPAVTFRRATDQLEMVAARFRRVTIEQFDFEPLMRLYDRPGCFFFCDPPYLASEAYYRGTGFCQKDHARFAQAANSVRASVLITYALDSRSEPLLREWYPSSRWYMVPCHRRSYMSSFSSKPDAPRRMNTWREVLLMNYEPGVSHEREERGQRGGLWDLCFS